MHLFDFVTIRRTFLGFDGMGMGTGPCENQTMVYFPQIQMPANVLILRMHWKLKYGDMRLDLKVSNFKFVDVHSLQTLAFTLILLHLHAR